MNFDNNQKPTERNTKLSKSASTATAAAPPRHVHEIPASRATTHDKKLTGFIPEENPDNSFIKEGKVSAHTINAPFTTIPFIPAATPILKRFDKATGQDLGFTYKASLSSEKNKDGRKDLIYKIDYVGFGIMSSKFNVQVAPLAAKIESGKEVYKGFGCNLSTLASPIGFVHERLGAKATVTDCNQISQSISVAPEASYQKSSAFKPLSTATFGYFFGNDAVLRIPASYVPSLKRIKDASPNLEEWEIIGKRIGLSIPLIPLADALDLGLHTVGAIAQASGSAITSKIKEITDAQQQVRASESIRIPSICNNHPDASQANDGLADWTNHATVKASITENLEKQQQSRLRPIQDIKPSTEEKANYIVQTGDTLEKIGEKTGQPWTKILELNKRMLKNNPDKIYPDQQLLIPENRDHAALIHHPIVQARIRENMSKQVQRDAER